MKQKKRISLLLIVVIGAIALFAACGSEKMILSSNGEVLSAKFLDPINKINKSNIYYSKDNNFLGIELNYDGSNANDIINTFKKDVNDIMNQESKQFEKYSEIKEIHFILLYKDRTTLTSIEYKFENGKFVKSNESIDSKNLDNYINYKPIEPIQNNDSNYNDSSLNNTNYMSVPNNGEFKLDNEHLKTLSFENNKLEYSNFKVDDGVIEIELLYNNQLTKGVVIQIQKNIKNMFGDKEIELNISQKHPMNRFEFEYKDNTWKEE